MLITSDAQRERSRIWLEGFRRELEAILPGLTGKAADAIGGSYRAIIRGLEDDLREYDELKAGNYQPPAIERLDQIAPHIARLRISKGVSQTELARRLGVSKQSISRSEDEEYQSASVAKLQEILDALGVKTSITLRA